MPSLAMLQLLTVLNVNPRQNQHLIPVLPLHSLHRRQRRRVFQVNQW